MVILDNTLMGRSIRMETDRRCDYCNRVIAKGKFATMVNREGMVAQGLFHGKLCFEGALANYEDMKKKVDSGEIELEELDG